MSVALRHADARARPSSRQKICANNCRPVYVRRRPNSGVGRRGRTVKIVHSKQVNSTACLTECREAAQQCTSNRASQKHDVRRGGKIFASPRPGAVSAADGGTAGRYPSQAFIALGSQSNIMPAQRSQAEASSLHVSRPFSIWTIESVIHGLHKPITLPADAV